MSHERGRSLRAESTGSVAEATIRSVLIKRGYVELSVEEAQREESPVEQTAMFRDFARRPKPSRFFVAQYPVGQSIYGLPLFADFWIYGAPDFPDGLALEVKWQQSTGSVDEKFPYLVLNIQHCYPCPALIIADGGGQRPGALHWLRDQAENNLVAVYTLAEFLAWSNRHL